MAKGTLDVWPVPLAPQLVSKPWGGRRLEEWGISLPAGATIGEAHLAAPGAIVSAGPLRGATLGHLVQTDPGSWVGHRGLRATGGRSLFPLLVKLIASETNLSIQVHPDDRAAAAAGLGTGKTEAYHILAADPGSALYLGLVPDVATEAFREACRHEDGTAARFLRRVPVASGMTFLIPAGTAHAPGAGITLYEIQQPSNVTFRLDDWGRVDRAGGRRELHQDQGFAVFDPDSRPSPIPRLSPPVWTEGRELLVATPFFALERMTPDEFPEVDLPAIDSPQVLTCLEGVNALAAGGDDLPIGRGETVVVPVNCPVQLILGRNGVILRGWVPDLGREIIRPARSAGVAAGRLRELGVELDSGQGREGRAHGPRQVVRSGARWYPYAAVVRYS
jgi:mannose-6-phosphate isomerase